MSPALIRLLILLPAMLYASYTDLKKQQISNRTCLVLLTAGFVLPFWPDWFLDWGEVVLMTGITLAMTLIPYIFFKGGAGDTKLCTAMASILGFRIIPVLFLASVLLGITALTLVLFKKRTWKSRIPAAPGLAVAAILCLLL